MTNCLPKKTCLLSANQAAESTYTVIEFLTDLFGDEVTSDRRVAVFTTPDRQARFFTDYQEAQRYAVGQSASQNVYFGLGLIRGQPKGRGKLDNIAAIGGLWCDIDISSPAHPKGNLPKNIGEAKSILAEMPLAPSIVVGSGHGLHAYWLLQEPWIFDGDEDRSHAALLAKRWHGKVCSVAAKRGWALENLGDLTRVKSGRPPARSNAASGSEVCSDTIGEQRRGVHLGHHARRWSAPSRLAAAIYDGSRPDLAEQAFAFDRDLRHLPFATSDSRGCWVSFEYFGHTAFDRTPTGAKSVS